MVSSSVLPLPSGEYAPVTRLYPDSLPANAVSAPVPILPAGSPTTCSVARRTAAES